MRGWWRATSSRINVVGHAEFAHVSFPPRWCSCPVQRRLCLFAHDPAAQPAGTRVCLYLCSRWPQRRNGTTHSSMGPKMRFSNSITTRSHINTASANLVLPPVPLVVEVGGRWHLLLPRLVRRLANESAQRSVAVHSVPYAVAMAARWGALRCSFEATRQSSARLGENPPPRHALGVGRLGPPRTWYLRVRANSSRYARCCRHAAMAKKCSPGPCRFCVSACSLFTRETRPVYASSFLQ